ncbi:MAG: M20/M25/M40 family metallo-hydrolase [Thermomicrobiales bacterium]
MTRDLDRQIESRRDEAIGLLQRLAAVPSITGDEGGVQDAIEPEMQRRGLEVDRWEMTVEEIAPYCWHVGDETRFAGRPNLAGTLKGEGDGRSILLNAHVDTVDYGDAALWTYLPLSGHVDGDRLYGRGSCDMKGASSAI